MIDIIIPCYNSHETLDRCLGSIICQRIRPELKITLVNDAGKGYEEIVKRYSSIINIREIGYEQNGGPAKARNFGLLNTNEPYIMFIDSDDVLSNPFSTVILLNDMMSDPQNVIVISNFIEEVAPLRVKTHEKDTSFMHGKLYKRSFLEKYNILQNENTRCNEDVGFNILALLIANQETEKIKLSNFVSYYWLFNPSSIVRADKQNYDRSTSLRGFADNLTYVFEELQKRNINTPNLLSEKVTSMERLYLLHKERTTGYPQFEEGNVAAIKNFYDKVYKPVEYLVTPELLNHSYNSLPFKGDEETNKKELLNFIEKLRG